MSIAVNKQVVRDFFDAIGKADIERLSALATDDLVWWVAPTSQFSGTYGKAQWLELLAQLFQEAAGSYAVAIEDLTAEDDRVSATAQADLELKNGKRYQNDYHALFWIRDRKVSACREYFDSHRAGLAFGFPS